jgi:hypothetical protein
MVLLGALVAPFGNTSLRARLRALSSILSQLMRMWNFIFHFHILSTIA